MGEKYSIVLAIKLNTHHQGVEYDNLDRFMKIGMRSFEKYLDKSTLHEFIVVTPKKDVGYIRDKLVLTFPNYPWKFVDEETVVNKALPPGWARQQMVKFTIARSIQTKLYLIIDDDVILTKPFTCKDMYHEGRVIMNREQIDFVMFFLWSSQLLEVDYDIVQNLPVVMGITPQIFITDVVRELMKWFETKYGSKWDEVITNHKYTEYSAYWIYLAKKNLQNTLYATSDDAPSVHGYVTSGPEHDLEKQLELAFRQNQKHWFTFVQTSLAHTVTKIETVVSKYLD